MTSNSDWIESFLEGDLQGDELKEFNEKLAGDKELKKDLRLREEIDKAIAETEVMELRDSLEEIHEITQAEQRQSRRFRLPAYARYAAAASMALLLLAGSLFVILRNTGSSDEKLFTAYYQPEHAIMLSRSVTNQQPSPMVIAMQKYAVKDYSGAIEIFATQRTNTAAEFYSGVAYIETGRVQEAIRTFEAIIRRNDNAFVEKATWYLGLCYLKTGEKQKAAGIFRNIAASNSLYKVKAAEIGNKLQE